MEKCLYVTFNLIQFLTFYFYFCCMIFVQAFNFVSFKNKFTRILQYLSVELLDERIMCFSDVYAKFIFKFIFLPLTLLIIFFVDTLQKVKTEDASYIEVLRRHPRFYLVFCFSFNACKYFGIYDSRILQQLFNTFLIYTVIFT